MRVTSLTGEDYQMPKTKCRMPKAAGSIKSKAFEMLVAALGNGRAGRGLFAQRSEKLLDRLAAVSHSDHSAAHGREEVFHRSIAKDPDRTPRGLGRSCFPDTTVSRSYLRTVAR